MNTMQDRQAKLAFISIFLALAGCAGAPPPAPTSVTRGDYVAVRRYGAELIERAIAQEKVQGISIALVDEQQVIWSQGFGYADAQAKRAATGDTIYRVGSISKLFTDTAALQLVERGRLNLDQPVQPLLAGFAPKSWDGTGTEITPRMLMTHHSGLQRDSAKSFQSKAPERFSHFVSKFNSHLAYPPGQILSYSNIGLTVLGSIVEKQSGRPFEDQLKQEVLEPIGMTHSDFSTAV
jgi:CubicO group peptidase (beta-lactamase class C family)